MKLQLQFDKTAIPFWANEYMKQLKPREKEEEQRLINSVSPATREQGYFKREDFLAVCAWKSFRLGDKFTGRNSENMVRAVSSLALSLSTEEAFRVRLLTTLEGVAVRTASALLHLGHREPYPILDRYALKSVGGYKEKEPSYYDPIWMPYVKFCRELAQEVGVDMRTLDRAFWAWGKNELPRAKRG